MPGKPAARIADSVAHSRPPVLTTGPGSPTVWIGKQPAWRGAPHGTVATLQYDKQLPGAAHGGADIHTCSHGQGIVIDGSTTVFINGLPACRRGDSILEKGGPPNKITGGIETVLIGD